MYGFAKVSDNTILIIPQSSLLANNPPLPSISVVKANCKFSMSPLSAPVAVFIDSSGSNGSKPFSQPGSENIGGISFSSALPIPWLITLCTSLASSSN